MKSKTKWGVVLITIARMLQQVPIPEIAQWAAVPEAAGMVLAGFGVRDAFDKAARARPERPGR